MKQNKEAKRNQYFYNFSQLKKILLQGHLRLGISDCYRLLSRDYEVRERIPVPHDNYFQSFFSSGHAILGNYNPPLSLKLNDVTLTDQ